MKKLLFLGLWLFCGMLCPLITNGYTITYNLNWWTESLPNPTSYMVDSWTFGLYQPTKMGEMFLWWTGSNGDTSNGSVYITQWSTWDKVYNAVWWDFEDIDVYYISSTWAVSYITLMDRNMWASNDDTSSIGSYGFHYQWWNNNWFQIWCWTNECSDDVTANMTAEEMVIWDDSYDNNWYNWTIFIGANDYWSWNKHYKGLWWWSGDNKNNWRWLDTMTSQNITNRQWPCPDGYHVPSVWEWNNLVRLWASAYTWAWNNLSISTDSDGLSEFSDHSAVTKFLQDFVIPLAGGRGDSYDGVLYYGGFTALWSSSPSNGSSSKILYYYDDTIERTNDYRWYGESVRCFKDNYIFSQPSMTINVDWWEEAWILVD